MDKFYSSWIVRLWRPSIGWVAVLSVFVAFVVNPVVLMMGLTERTSVDTSSVIGLVTLVLGSIGIRGFEKIKDKQ